MSWASRRITSRSTQLYSGEVYDGAKSALSALSLSGGWLENSLQERTHWGHGLMPMKVRRLR